MKNFIILSATAVATASLFVGLGVSSTGCSDSPAATKDGGVIVPPNEAGSPGSNTDAGNPGGGDGGACSNKPAGCFCGTPTTQAQFYNRCTNSVALPFTTTFTAGTTGDLP